MHLRLVSDVPFGAFLSGGVDSSLVAQHMAEFLDQPVQTFSMGFHESDHDESEYAKMAASVIGAEHHAETVEVDALGLLPTIVHHFGQPFADSSAIPTYMVSRLARRRVKMVLSGDGGDEVFGGYNTYEAVLAASGQSASGGGVGKMLIRRFMSMGRAMARRDPVMSAYLSVYQHFSEDTRRKLYRERFQGLARNRCEGRAAVLLDPNTPLLSRLQHTDILSYLPMTF